MRKINLPVPLEMTMGVSEALRRRRTARSSRTDELPPDVLSTLLWSAAGITSPDGRRTIPSVLNLQAARAWVLRADGVWLYDAKENSLSQVLEKDCRAESTNLAQEFVTKAPVTLVFTVRCGLTERKLPLEYYMVDAAAMAQNAYFCAAALGICGCVRAGFDSGILSRAMHLPENEKALLVFTAGLP